MSGIPQRYFTEHLPGVGGRIKSCLEDFIVHEVPLYHPSDRGEHTYFEIEKSDLTTLEAVERISGALGVSSREIGFAGLKDRRGITRQTLSVRRVPPVRVLALRISQIRVLWARLHTNKLRVGHLRGNRFRIRVRDALVTPMALDSLENIIAIVRARGLPNYYGPQRFGNRGDSFRIGLALLRHQHEYAVRRILGYPSRTENNPHVLLARHRFMDGDLRGALAELPRSYRAERSLMRYLIQSQCNWRGAAKRLPHAVKKIYFSALQSHLFNGILATRLELMGDPGRLLDGDLAFLHRNGAIFDVEDGGDVSMESIERRARNFEISPSGPIYGIQMPSPRGLQRELEQDALNELDLRLVDFHQLMPGLRMPGGRRPLRVEVRELEWKVDGSDLVLKLFLPKGSYATTFLREILKTDRPAEAFYTDRADAVEVPAVGE